MSKQKKSTSFLHKNTHLTYIPFYTSFRYLSVSTDEIFLNTPGLWKDTYSQDSFISNWDTCTLEDINHFYWESVDLELDLPVEYIVWRKYPTLTSFFTSQMVNVPSSFQKAHSLYKPSIARPQTRLITMLMRHGKKNHVSKCYSYSLRSLISKLSLQNTKTKNILNWRLYYLIFTNLRFFFTNYFNKSLIHTSKIPKTTLYDVFNQEYSSLHYKLTKPREVQNLIIKELLKYFPLFSFYIRRLDKLKRKHSRGKRSKYIIIWKYVPTYRRLAIVLKWFTRDVRFQKSRTFQSRLSNSLDLLLFEKSKHLVFRLRHFAHNFVFTNFKKTLLKTLKATT